MSDLLDVAASLPPEPTPSDARLLTVAEAQARIGAEPEWLVDKMLALGDMSLWVAKPGVGKSALLRQLARAVSSGEPFLGRDVKQGQVVYLALEGARATLAHLIRLGHDPASDRILVYIDEVGEGGSNPAEWLREKLAAISPALIIVDCLGDFARIDERSNNAGYGAIYRALGPVLLYAQNQRTHIALIHHAGKRVDQGTIDAALGSTGITGKPGTVFSYRLSDPQDRQSLRILSCSKHRPGDPADLPDVVLQWDPETQTVSVSGLAERFALLSTGLAAIREVRRQPGMTQPALIKELEGRKQVRVAATKALVEERIFRRDGRGVRSEPFILTLVHHDPETAWRAFCSRQEDVPIPFPVPASGNRIPDPGISVPPSTLYGGTGNVSSTHVDQDSVPGFPHIGNGPVPETPSPEPAAPGTEIPETDPDGMFARWQAQKGQPDPDPDDLAWKAYLRRIATHHD